MKSSPEAELDDDADIGLLVETNVRRQRHVLSRTSDLEDGCNRRRVLIHDERDGLDRLPLRQMHVRRKRDRHHIIRPVRCAELDHRGSIKERPRSVDLRFDPIPRRTREGSIRAQNARGERGKRSGGMACTDEPCA